MPDAVGLPAELDEPVVVQDAVDDGGSHLVVSEERPPTGGFEIGRDDYSLTLAGAGDGSKDRVQVAQSSVVNPTLLRWDLHAQARDREVQVHCGESGA